MWTKNLRVLFLAYRDIKNPSAVGGDFYLWELANGLSRMGHRVTLVSSQFDGSEQRERIDGVEVFRVKGVWSLPLSVFNVYMKRLKFCFDIVVEEAMGGQRPPFMVGVYAKEPLIAVWHQKHDKIFREQYPFPVAAFLSLFELFLARLYRNHTIVTPSNGAKEKLMELGFRRENVKVVYDGVGEMFRNAKTSRRRENVIVCLGKLRRYKRVDHVLFAFKRALNHLDNACRLVIAGKVSEIDRSYVDWLHKLAKRLEIENYVEIKTNISESEKLELLEKAKLLVQPSPVEGFSIVVAEANRCATPVVVSDGVPSDVVVNGHNGLVFPFGDVKSLAVAIIQLMKDDVLWSKMSRNAYEWSQKFTWENSVSEFLNILEHISDDY